MKKQGKASVGATITFSIGLLLSSASEAALGTSDGGGGVGVRCFNGPQSTLELLDLHEAKLAGLKIELSPQAEPEAIDIVATKFATHNWINWSIPANYIQFLKSNFVEPIFQTRPFRNPFTGKEVHIQFVDQLPLSSDIGSYVIAPGCHLEQIAYFIDGMETLQIARPQWNELSWIHRAALISHEIQYFIDRFEGLENFGSTQVSTSERIRRFVGAQYSSLGIASKYNDISKQSWIECYSEGAPAEISEFYASVTGGDQFTINFRTAYGRSSPYQIRATFLANLSELVRFNGQLRATANLEFVGEPNVPLFVVKLSKQPWNDPVIEMDLIKNGSSLSMGAPQALTCFEQN